MKDCVDEEVLFLIGEKYQKTLISLELRACPGVNDAGIIGMCERLSDIWTLRRGKEPSSETERYQIFAENPSFSSKNNLEFLNLGDLKQIKNASMKCIAHNIMNKLQDLSIWGSYFITDEGFSYLCTQHKHNFKRVNYCGCYDISEDSRLSQVQVYIQADDFGINIDYDSYLV